MQNLSIFINELSQINAMFSPGGSMSADGAGGRSSQQELVYELKKEAASLQLEALKKIPDKNTLEKLAAEIEGTLLGLNSSAVIDNRTLDRLLGKLHGLKKS